MRSEIDTLMQQENIDVLWVMGSMKHNPDMVYFTGPQEVRSADLFIRKGQSPIVFHATSMEREEAAKSGLKTIAFDTAMPINSYLKGNNGNLSMAVAQRYKDALISLGIKSGRIAVMGQTAIQEALPNIENLKILMPEIQFFSIFKNSPIEKARTTKEVDEVARIRKMGKTTTDVVNKVSEFLTHCVVKNEILMDSDGTPVTIGRVKRLINLWLAEMDAENPEETIFSIGRDAGIPHNTGNADDMIMLGKAIVFDIYPCEKGGGYFYDFTRTWCLGYAPDPVIKLYEEVLSVYTKVMAALKPGMPFVKVQDLTCHLFKELGHPTIQDNPEITEGYVHSIGHGLGLNVHENPFSGVIATDADRLNTGVVFSIEPGLYYPSQNMGVRIEDTVYLNPQGEFEILAEYPHDLVLPMKKS